MKTDLDLLGGREVGRPLNLLVWVGESLMDTELSLVVLDMLDD